MCDLDTAYQDSDPSDSASWKEKDYCAALYSGNKRWHRAQIMSIKDDIVEVELNCFTYTWLKFGSNTRRVRKNS